MNSDALLSGLPGADLVREGLADLAAGRTSVSVFLVAMAAPRLKRAGLLCVVPPALGADAELQLHRLLRKQGGDAYSRYNALVRELVSFEQSLDHRVNRSLVP